jgi:hypothetical protein
MCHHKTQGGKNAWTCILSLLLFHVFSICCYDDINFSLLTLFLLLLVSMVFGKTT